MNKLTIFCAFIAMLLGMSGVVLGVHYSASQAQLQRVEADSCHVFEFVDLRFTKPTKTETAAQRAITTEFAGYLERAVTDCATAGYRITPKQPQ